MALFRGSGLGEPQGLPAEAVSADLCALREDVRTMALHVYDLKQTHIKQSAQLTALMERIAEQTEKGNRLAEAFRADMMRLGAALLENTRELRRADGTEPQADGVGE